MSVLRSVTIGVLLACSMALPQAAYAQSRVASYPDRPLRFLVGFAPGGSGDIVARLTAQKMMASLGQPVVVENRVGAGGAIAADFVAKAPPDGYNWVLLPSGHATQGAMMKSLPYDPVKDFAWISTLTTYPMILAVSPGSQISTLAELIRLAKQSPGKLTYSSVGMGTGHHLLGEWLNAEAGMELTHVPFKGGTAAMTEVLAGRVDLMIETITLALPHVRSGKMRGLAVSSRRPLAALPAVPAASDTLPAIEYESWLGIAVAPGTPAEIVARLNAEVRKALALPDIQRQLADLGGGAAPSSPEEFRARVERDITRFRAIVDTRKIERQ